MGLLTKVISKAAPAVLPAAKTVTKQIVDTVKKTDGPFFRTRDAILAVFRGKGPEATKAIESAISKNKVGQKDIANQKVGGSYNPEFQRLWNMVIDGFRGIGREDLATEFSATVPIFTEDKHDISFISTLLNGAGTKKPTIATTVTVAPDGNKSVNVVKVIAPAQRADQNYNVLLPFRNAMADALTAKGIAAPSGMEDLSQIFYNNIVAQKGSAYEAIDFFEMSPGDVYHLDQAVVDAIVTYFKDLADRKAKGEILPKQLDRMAEVTLEVQRDLNAKAKTEVAGEIGMGVKSNKKQLMIIAVVVVVVLVLLFMKK